MKVEDGKMVLATTPESMAQMLNDLIEVIVLASGSCREMIKLLNAGQVDEVKDFLDTMSKGMLARTASVISENSTDDVPAEVAKKVASEQAAKAAMRAMSSHVAGNC